jgi:hypothetical protein
MEIPVPRDAVVVEERGRKERFGYCFCFDLFS